ncbi:beta-mannosidase, partial [Rhodococcus sp. EPR-157]|uniref:glycoside hydrolase family 2 protein n=1 Tax=Rhodococcus sp. EPR-157 TaxID=1813677 RepID=UPI0007BB037A
GSGALGFRSVHLDRTDRAVTLTVNGIRTFARGGCWVPPDPVRMWVDSDRMRFELERVRAAGHNMVRVVGTLMYEQREFWSLCAELGILVWQDVMVATFDPPEDEDFVDVFEQELAVLTGLVGGNPALAVVSGGSETQQQPTMLGVPSDGQYMSLLEKMIPEFVESELPGTPYVTSSPSSTTGELHTHVGDGIAHYFGVGGYLRPLSDVRTARVRFAAECLAFSIPPERRSVERMFGSATVAGHHPDWKAAVPRDRGSSWDFEDVRDHYVRDIFGVDPHLVRRDDAELYLDYGRAAVCEAVSASYMHWRRTDSECTGALVLTLRDLVPGAGWGLIDSAGIPKAPWYSLARLSSPVAVFLVDDGLDGLTVELVDDTAETVHGTLRVTLHGPTGAAGEPYECRIELGPHSSRRISVDRLIGSFTDANHAYRFGTQTYAAVSVDVVDPSGTTLAQAVHLVGARHARQNDIGLEAHATPVDDGVWSLTVSTQWAAQYVCIDVDGLEVSDSWFHLAPGSRRVLTVTGDKAQVTGHVRALNSVKRAQIG